MDKMENDCLLKKVARSIYLIGALSGLELITGCVSTTRPDVNVNKYESDQKVDLNENEFIFPEKVLNEYFLILGWGSYYKIDGLFIKQDGNLESLLTLRFMEIGYSNQDANHYSSVLSTTGNIVISQNATDLSKALVHERTHKNFSELSKAEKDSVNGAIRDISTRIYDLEEAKITGYFDDSFLIEREKELNEFKSGEYDDLNDIDDGFVVDYIRVVLSSVNLLRGKSPFLSLYIIANYGPENFEEIVVRMLCDEYEPSAMRAIEKEYPEVYEILSDIQSRVK